MTMSSKALEIQALAHVREVVRAIIDRDFRGTVHSASKRFGLAQSSFSEFLNGRRGLGVKSLIAIANYEGISLDELMGRTVVQPTALSAIRYMCAAEGIPPEVTEDAIVRRPKDPPEQVVAYARALADARKDG